MVQLVCRAFVLHENLPGAVVGDMGPGRPL